MVKRPRRGERVLLHAVAEGALSTGGALLLLDLMRGTGSMSGATCGEAQFPGTGG